MLRATDDCTTALARVIDTELCIRILNPLSDMAECPMNLAAIKMEEKVIRSATESVARAVLDRVVPTLIKVSLLSVNQRCHIHTVVIDLTIMADKSKRESFLHYLTAGLTEATVLSSKSPTVVLHGMLTFLKLCYKYLKLVAIRYCSGSKCSNCHTVSYTSK